MKRRGILILAGLVLAACTAPAPERESLDAGNVLHLEDYVGATARAVLDGSPDARPNPAESRTDVRTVARGAAVRRVIGMPAAESLVFQVRLPTGARFDFGMSVVEPRPVMFRVAVSEAGTARRVVFEEEHDDPDLWVQHSVDLSAYADKTVDVVLEATSLGGSNISLWAAPTISGSERDERPNVILYVIDGAGAEYMSLYGFNLRTTPNLEALAEEGVVFERAYSNSRWTKPSTSSFLTSLHHSVLGGFGTTGDVLPEAAVPMAEHFHRDGYQTALLTGNPLAGRLSGHERGVDTLIDARSGRLLSASALHAEYWDWRDAYPGAPYWVHFQTIDVHMNALGVPPPFAGLYLGSEERATFDQWRERLGLWPTEEELQAGGVSPEDFFHAARMLYAELMAYQDHEIGRLVEQLKADGSWDNTLLIIASDHGQHEAGLVHPDRPTDGRHTHMRPEQTRIPLMFVWPRDIPGGRRYGEPVSMIDLLPTVLDLAGLPPADMSQGRSLGPVLRGSEDEKRHPVFFDEFYQDPGNGELRGWVEVIDGRWGASLAINQPERIPWRQLPAGAGRRGEYEDAETGRSSALLLFDMWNDPRCMSPVNDLYPELAAEYLTLLEDQWESHNQLAQLVDRGSTAILTPEQLETLRALGYLR